MKSEIFLTTFKFGLGIFPETEIGIVRLGNAPPNSYLVEKSEKGTEHYSKIESDGTCVLPNLPDGKYSVFVIPKNGEKAIDFGSVVLFTEQGKRQRVVPVAEVRVLNKIAVEMDKIIKRIEALEEKTESLEESYHDAMDGYDI